MTLKSKEDAKELQKAIENTYEELGMHEHTPVFSINPSRKNGKKGYTLTLNYSSVPTIITHSELSEMIEHAIGWYAEIEICMETQLINFF